MTSDWISRAACAGVEPLLFDIDDRTDPDARLAVAYCHGCPVLTDCYAHHVDRGFHGVAAGLVWKGNATPQQPTQRRRRNYARWSTPALRSAHAAYAQGDRAVETVDRNREYERRKQAAAAGRWAPTSSNTADKRREIAS